MLFDTIAEVDHSEQQQLDGGRKWIVEDPAREASLKPTNKDPLDSPMKPGF